MRALSDYPAPDTQVNECRVIGDFIANPEYRGTILEIVTSEMFMSAKGKALWATLMKMHQLRQAIDLTTIYPHCDKEFFNSKILDVCEPCSYRDANDHASALAKAYIARKAYLFGVSLVTMSSEGIDSDEIMEACKGFDKEVNQSLSSGDMVSLNDALDNYIGRLEKGDKKPIRTGFPTIDTLLGGGLTQGQLLIIGARPSAGKTSLGMDMAMRQSGEGHNVCFFTIEMTPENLAKRMLVGTGYVNTWSLGMEAKDWNAIEQANQAVRRDNLYISRHCATLTQIVNKITTMAQGGRCDIAYIDYLQLIRGGGRDLRERITIITNTLKQTANELEIPIVLMSQLNRDSSKEGRRPYSTDLKESGSSEQDADIIFLLETPRDGNVENRIDVWIDKVRDGKKLYDRPVRLLGSNNFTNFYEIDEQY